MSGDETERIKMETSNKFLLAAVIFCTLVFFIAEHQCASIVDQEFERKLLPREVGKKSKSLLASVFPVPKTGRDKDYDQDKNPNARSVSTSSAPYYDACVQGKRHCFPNPESDCFHRRNCAYLVTWRFLPKLNSFEFQVVRNYLTDKTNGQLCSKKPLTDTRYLALGLSGKSSKSSGKLIIECSLSQTGNFNKKVIFGWSTRSEFTRWDYICSDKTTVGKLSFCKVEINGDSMICGFQIQSRVVFNHEIFNFKNAQYFLHVTSGCNISDIKKSFMDGGSYAFSEMLVDFRPHEKATASFRSVYSLWHGTLMTVAWFVLIPNGMFISRYFKESFIKISIFKYRLWYAGHNIMMAAAFLITIGAIGVILQERSKVDFAWPVEKSTLFHFNLGFAASLALTVQVGLGCIRCHGRKLRRTFGTVHLFLGFTCYIISSVCIALSYNVGMPCNVIYYTLVIGLWTLLCHVAMTIHFCFLDKQLGLLIYRALYPFPIAPVTYDELPGSRIRLFIFMIHMAGNILISTVMLLDYVATGACKH